MLRLRNVFKSYKYGDIKIKVLDDINIDFKKGELVFILGKSGSGKSTLAKLIMGLLIPNSGEILIDGVALSNETIEDLRLKLGIVFQNPDNQFVGITVRDDIAGTVESISYITDKMLIRIMADARLIPVNAGNIMTFLKKLFSNSFTDSL